MSDQTPVSNTEHPGHEELGLSVRRVIHWTIGIAVAAAGSLAITAWLLGVFQANRPSKEFLPTDVMSRREVRGAPLDPYQVSQKLRYLANQNELLSNYGWVDRQEGIARIPIERAMEIYTERNVEGTR